MNDNTIYFNGPETEEDYKAPNIHDIDAYDALLRQLISTTKGGEPVRIIPEQFKIGDKSIKYNMRCRDPYATGQNLYRNRIITLKYGLNVLVGPNGSGKSTIIGMIKDALSSNNYDFYSYDNMIDGGSRSISKAGFYGDLTHMANMLCSSEGEGIMNNLSKVAQSIGKFVRNQKNEYPEYPVFILLDAVDSGLSVNNIVILKDLFNCIIEDCSNAVIIVSCNAYEMTRNAYCWDVKNSKKVKFNSYEEYYKFICESGEGE